MKMMPIMSKKIQENKGTDHAQNGSREKRGDKSRSDKQRRENIGKVRKGEKEKKKLGLLEIGITEILVKYTEIYNPHRL